MFWTFLKHGSNSALALGLAAVGILALFGIVAVPVAWIAAGALSFYLSEYSWHRFVFHARPAQRGWVRRLQHRLHYDHHAEPDRLDLLFLPLWFVTPNLVVTGALVAAMFGAGRLPAVLAGIMLALLHYEWVHFVAHVPHRPATAVGRWMKQYHLRHHFISEKLWFGVSNPALDLLYRTYRTPKEAERSATVRTLHG